MQSEAEAFLQRIRAYPDDDTPRLIFADWLEEHGAGMPGAADRARFIRVQVALAHVAGADGDDDRAGPRADRAALDRLRRQERELLDRYREEWTAPFRAFASGPEFRRGFVEEVKVAARQFVRHVHELFAATPLRHLHLLDVGGSLPAVLECPYLSRLSVLTVYGSHIGEPLARGLARSPHLAGLRTLRLRRNRFDGEAVAHLAASAALARVEELDLAENQLGETGARVLAAGTQLGALRRLELAGNGIGPAGAEVLAASERLTSLDRLGLANNEIGTARLQSLSRVHELLRVPVLDLSNNGLTVAGLPVILMRPGAAAVEGAAVVRELDLSRNELGDDGARVVAASPQLAGLRMLKLVGCAIGDAGARAIAESRHLGQLVALDLGNNPIGDPGFRPFLEAPQLKSLQHLVPPAIGVSQRMLLALSSRYHHEAR